MAKSINIAFPLLDDLDNNTFLKTTKTTKSAIISDLILLLMTKKGERWFNPEYGCDLRKFLFEPNDEILDAEIKEAINNDVSAFLPNLTIEDVSVVENTYNTTILLLKATYTEDFFTFTENIKVSFTA